jgi:photosystem II stability/assembly factor-like uncharacterized protein
MRDPPCPRTPFPWGERPSRFRTLTETDVFNDGETSIAVNPRNPDEIIITAFSGAWGANAPLWHSTDGGRTWTKRFTSNAPPGVPAAGCPWDQTVDYGRED